MACIFSVSATTLISSAPRVKFATTNYYPTTDVTLAGGLRILMPKIQLSKPTKTYSDVLRSYKTRISCSASPEILLMVRSIFAHHLSIDESNVTAETKLADLGADSLDTAEIVMHLEKEFEVTIEEGVENIVTIQDAADIVDKHGHYGVWLLIEWLKTSCRLKGDGPPSGL